MNNHYETLKKLYEEYVKNKEKYPIKEKSFLENYVCFFCHNIINSAYIEMKIEKNKTVLSVFVHLDCIEDFWINF